MSDFLTRPGAPTAAQKKGGITASTIRGNFVHLHHASSHQQRAARSS